jgi:uncharacterized protein
MKKFNMSIKTILSRVLIFAGLMHFIVVQNFSQNNSRFSFPEPSGYLNDFEDIFKQSQARLLENLTYDFYDQTGIQLAIVTIGAENVEREFFDQFSIDLFNYWGVGSKEKNDGILIAISKNYSKIRIVNGLGIEKHISDEETKEIIDYYFLPYFSEGLLFEGMVSGLFNIMIRLREFD